MKFDKSIDYVGNGRARTQTLAIPDRVLQSLDLALDREFDLHARALIQDRSPCWYRSQVVNLH